MEYVHTESEHAGKGFSGGLIYTIFSTKEGVKIIIDVSSCGTQTCPSHPMSLLHLTVNDVRLPSFQVFEGNKLFPRLGKSSEPKNQIESETIISDILSEYIRCMSKDHFISMLITARRDAYYSGKRDTQSLIRTALGI